MSNSHQNAQSTSIFFFRGKIDYKCKTVAEDTQENKTRAERCFSGLQFESFLYRALIFSTVVSMGNQDQWSFWKGKQAVINFYIAFLDWKGITTLEYVTWMTWQNWTRTNRSWIAMQFEERKPWFVGVLSSFTTSLHVASCNLPCCCTCLKGLSEESVTVSSVHNKVTADDDSLWVEDVPFISLLTFCYLCCLELDEEKAHCLMV